VRSTPFSYLTWEDSVAWLACEYGLSTQWIIDRWQPLVDTMPTYIAGYIRLDRLIDAMNRKRPFVDWQDMKNAQRVCFAFTVFNLVPVVVCSVLLAAAALAAIAIAVALVQLAISCMLIVFVFSHSR